MKSISTFIDGPSLAAQVRMERQTHRGAFLLVEGSTDIKRFERVVDESRCSFVNCFGKPNVIDAIQRLYDDGFQGVVGMVDADFDRVLNVRRDEEALVISAFHDFDLDASTTSVFERYMAEVADQGKLRALGGARKFLDALLRAIKPLSAFRFANVKHKLGYSLESMNIEQFFDGLTINVGAMVDAASWGKFADAASKGRLAAHIGRYSGSNLDLFQVTCGHDFCAALGVALRGVVGSRRYHQTWGSEIEMHFRLAFDLNHLRETAVFAAVRRWEFDNVPYVVLVG